MGGIGEPTPAPATLFTLTRKGLTFGTPRPAIGNSPATPPFFSNPGELDVVGPPLIPGLSDSNWTLSLPTNGTYHFNLGSSSEPSGKAGEQLRQSTPELPAGEAPVIKTDEQPVDPEPTTIDPLLVEAVSTTPLTGSGSVDSPLTPEILIDLPPPTNDLLMKLFGSKDSEGFEDDLKYVQDNGFSRRAINEVRQTNNKDKLTPAFYRALCKSAGLETRPGKLFDGKANADPVTMTDAERTVMTDPIRKAMDQMASAAKGVQTSKNEERFMGSQGGDIQWETTLDEFMTTKGKYNFVVRDNAGDFAKRVIPPSTDIRKLPEITRSIIQDIEGAESVDLTKWDTEKWNQLGIALANYAMEEARTLDQIASQSSKSGPVHDNERRLMRALRGYEQVTEPEGKTEDAKATGVSPFVSKVTGEEGRDNRARRLEYQFQQYFGEDRLSGVNPDGSENLKPVEMNASFFKSIVRGFYPHRMLKLNLPEVYKEINRGEFSVWGEAGGGKAKYTDLLNRVVKFDSALAKEIQYNPETREKLNDALVEVLKSGKTIDEAVIADIIAVTKTGLTTDDAKGEVGAGDS